MRYALSRLAPDGSAFSWLKALVERGLDRPPLPGCGHTLERWRMLAAVAEHDLSLAKLYEGHSDAIAILSELGADAAAPAGTIWGTWAAESPAARAVLRDVRGNEGVLDGAKAWCSGAGQVSHGLLTAWHADGRGPQLVALDMRQEGVQVDAGAWNAVGMAQSASVDVRFSGARVRLVGEPGRYLSRPGFWHGGAGIAACWHGGALGLARHLRDAVEQAARPADDFRKAALGKVDVALGSTAAMLRDAALHIDAHPQDDARGLALRVRLAAEATARQVIDEVGRTLGAGPFCRNAHFARQAADLPVFVRQSHAERDCASLSECLESAGPSGWDL